MRPATHVTLGAVALLLWSAVASLHAETLVASYYGSESGKRTANGERFAPNAMTCAHRTLPFGTMLRVTYQGRSVTCRVNDRGPFIAGRGLDLSVGAARVIGLTAAGVGRIDVERVR